MVSTQGFNALLKIVEEPPEHLVFIFATTEPDKVLTTIRSRTHHYPFRLIPPATLRALLERLCAEERVTVAPAVFPLVVRAGGGSARDSLSVLDQLLAGAGPEGVTYQAAVDLLGVTDAALLDEMVDALAAGDGAAVFGAVDKVVEAGHDPRRFAADLLQRLRDLVILAQVPTAAGSGLIDAPDDEVAGMVAQAERLGPATAARFAEILHAGLIDMRGTTTPRLTLELMCARMLLPGTQGDGPVLQRLERLERRLAIGGEPTRPAEPARDRSGSGPVDSPRSTPDGSSPERSRAGQVKPGRSKGSRSASSADDLEPELSSPATAASHEMGGSAATARPARPSDVGPSGPSSASGTPRPEAPDLGLPAPPTLTHRAGGPVPAARGDAPASAPSGRPAAHPPTGGQAAERPPAGAAAPPNSHESAGASGPAAAGSVPSSSAGSTAAGPASAGSASAGSASAESISGEPREGRTTPAAAAGPLDATDVRRVWPEVLTAVQRRRRTTQILLESATVARVDGNVLMLTMPSAGMARRVVETANADLLRSALHEVLGVDWLIRCDSGDGNPAAATGSRSGRSGPAGPNRPGSGAVGARSGGGGGQHRSSPSADDIPPPEAPPEDEEIPDNYRDEPPSGAARVTDPEEAAIELLASQFGATRID
jgi:DNA polymerase-3 subunit gamma/tau